MSKRVTTQWLSPEQQRVWRAYLLGSAKINDYLNADLRRHGVDIGEYGILVYLAEAEDRRLRMSEVAEFVHQSRSRLTHTVARLEKRGLVVRTTCPTDRRGVWAELTDAGNDLLLRAAPDHVEAVRRIFVHAVDPADYDSLGRAFSAVLNVRLPRPVADKPTEE